MSAEDRIALIAFKILVPLISAIGKEAFKRLATESPIMKAINNTAEKFECIEGLDESLTRWCESDAFPALLDRFASGERELSGSNLIDSFIESSDFYMEDDTQPNARKMIQYFFENLEEELYTSEGQTIYLAKRMEVQHTISTTRSERMEAEIAEVSRGVRHIASQLPPLDLESSTDVKELIFDKKVDAARQLVDDGYAIAARSQLLAIREEAQRVPTSARLRFRIAANLGACALSLEDWDTAKRELRDALLLQPEDPKALRNAAIAALLDEDWEEALILSNRALEADGDHRQGVDTYLESLFELKRFEELDTFIEENSWIVVDLSCPLVLARIEFDRGHFEEAESLIRRSLDVSTTKPSAVDHALLAQIISSPIRSRLSEDPPLPWKFPKEIRLRLECAEFHLTKAIEALEGRQDQKHLVDALINRSGVRGMLGRHADGLRDCERVLSERPEETTAIMNKGFCLLHMGKENDAISILEGLKPTDEWPSVALMVAGCHYENGRPQEAVTTIQPFWQSGVADHHQLLISQLLLGSFDRLKDREAVDSLIQNLKNKWPNDPEAVMAIAQQRLRDGNVDEAIELMYESHRYSEGNQRDRIGLQLAETLLAERRYAEAAEAYRNVIATGINNRPFRAYLTALFNAGYYAEALEVSCSIRDGGKAIPLVSEIEVLVLEIIGDLVTAEKLLVELVQMEPKNTSHRIHLANVNLRLNEPERGREVIRSIKFDDVKDDARTLVDLATIKRLLTMDGVLPLVYRARAIDQGNPDMHLAYVSLFLESEHNGELGSAPQEVGIDCTVHLTRNGDRRTFTIEEMEPGDTRQDVLFPADPLSIRLTGLKKGDLAILQQSSLETVEYIVSEVQSKYVHAFQQSLADFQTRFPDNQGIQSVSVQDDDYKKVLTSVDDRYEFVSGVAAGYRARQFPLGTFARLVGYSQLTVWKGIIVGPGERFLVAEGTSDEAKQQSKLTSSAGVTTMDLTSLLTLGLLDLLDKAPMLFGEVLVSQAVVDELTECIANEYSGALPTSMLSKSEEGYILREVDPEDITLVREFIQRILDFIDSSCTVVSAPGMLGISNEELERYREVFGLGSLTSAIVAKDNCALLYSDDLLLRNLVRNSPELGEVEGISSLSVLLVLKERGILSADEYNEAIRTLIISNYQFVTVKAEFLVWAFRRDGLLVSSEIQKIFSVLKGPDCSEDSAVIVAAESTKKAWLEFDLWHQKIALLDILIDSFLEGRIETQVLEKFKKALESQFSLFPMPLGAILEHIETRRGGIRAVDA